MQVMYSLNKNSLLDPAVDAPSSSTFPLPTARGIHSTILRDARRNAVNRNWKTLQ